MTEIRKAPYEEEAINEVEQHHEDRENISKLLLSRVVSLRTPLPENVYLLKKGEVGILSLGDIVSISGKAKNGKTQLEKIFASALTGGEFGGLSAAKENLSVLFCDTEQNPINTQKFARDVHKLRGWSLEEDNPQFRCLNLRADSASQRVEFIEEAIKTFTPDVVMIDGIKDLLSDINDTTQSAQVLNFLMRLTKEYSICLIAILHENKNDANLRGHIGTEITNKCSEIWKVKKDGSMFEVSQEISRNAPAEGFSFYLDNGTPVEAQIAPKIDKQAEAERKMQLNFQYALKGGKLSYSSLRDVYMEVSGLAKKTSETHISTGLRRGYIRRDDDGMYHIYRLPINTL